MGEPTIKRGSDHFFTTLYEGTNSGRRVGKFLPFTAAGTISNSCVFNHGTSGQQIQLAAPGSAGNQKIATVSCWFKRNSSGLSDQQYLYSIWNGTDDGSPYLDDRHYLQLRTNDQLYVNFWGDGVMTNRTFEDTSRWYHYLLAVDSTQSTAADRIKLYIDGELITSFASTSYFAQDSNLAFAKRAFTVGNTKAGDNAQETFDGAIAEFNFVEGSALTPSTFGQTDTTTGRWIPKTLSGITYGTNGFRLTFASAAALGTDSSGNGNNLTPANLTTTDQSADNPNDNFMAFDRNRYLGTQQATEDGGMTVYASSGSGYTGMAADKEIPQSGKWYWEVKLAAVGSVQGITNPTYGVIDRNIKEITGFSTSSPIHQQVGGMGGSFWSGFRFGGLLSTANDFTIGSHAAATNDYVAFAFDMDNGKAWWGFKDGSADLVWYANDGGTDGNPATGANPTVTFNPKDHRFVPIQGFYAPGSGYSARYYYNFGQKTFDITAPTGFVGLKQSEFPETTNEKPDLVWIKNRDATDNWQVYDSTRGPRLDLSTNTTDYQSSTEDGLTKFLKGGFEIEDDVSVNTLNESYVAYNWKANGGTEVSNDQGSVTSNVQVNSDAGFSIVRYTGTGSALDVGHGLSQAPEWIMARPITQTGGYHWSVYLKDAGGGSTGYYQSINQNIADTSNSTVWDAHPTATVVNCGSAMPNGAHEVIMYCWHSVPGYSQFGSYTGNANADGPCVYLGFKPAWILFKSNNTASWYITDNKMFTFNPNSAEFHPDTTAVQTTLSGGRGVDYLSNGFKIRQESGYGYNYSGIRTHYMAFAEHPFIGSGSKSPVTAV